MKRIAATGTVFFVAISIPLRTSAQTSPGPSSAPSSSGQYDRPVSWKLLVPNFLSDQQQIWSFPATVVEGKNLIPTTAFLGATAGLILVDPTEGAYFRSTSQFNSFNHIFTSNATMIGTIVAPVSLYAAGLIRKDSKMQHTALLAGEAVADAEVVTTVLKDATKRLRPEAIPPNGNFWDTWFESGGSPLRGNGSFPSGHTIAAFSVATVIAKRYGNHRWVPYVSYGAAALVGFSRLTLSAHFLSDVFVGGVLGYTISTYTVLRQ